MGIDSLIGIGAKLGYQMSGDEVAREVADAFLFGGSYQTVIGSDTRNVVGARLTHLYGDDTQLRFGRFLLGPFVGLFLEGFAKATMVAGISGDVRFNYGQKVDLIYGGPISEIYRGPIIKKTNFRQLATVSSGIPLLGLKTAAASLGTNRPKLPDPDDAPAVNPLAFNPEIDAKYEKAILACSQVMAAMNAALDLAVRFVYPDYQYDHTKPPDANKPLVPKSLLLVQRIVSNMCMGMIYHMELLSIHDNDAMNAQSGATSSLAKGVGITTTSATKGQSGIKRFLARAKRFLGVLIYNTIVLAMVIAVVAALTALVAGALLVGGAIAAKM